MIMDKVYVIEFKAFHHYNDSDTQDYEERRVFGVIDTERRAICYLRRFYEENDVEYKGGYMQITEHKNGMTEGKAERWYETTTQRITETLFMRPMEINGLHSPQDEIIDTYC